LTWLCRIGQFAFGGPNQKSTDSLRFFSPKQHFLIWTAKGELSKADKASSKIIFNKTKK
jgi:hypothetical protein